MHSHADNIKENGNKIQRKINKNDNEKGAQKNYNCAWYCLFLRGGILNVMSKNLKIRLRLNIENQMTVAGYTKAFHTGQPSPST